jgi:hypothetical protein
VESLNGKLRDDYLNEEVFNSLTNPWVSYSRCAAGAPSTLAISHATDYESSRLSN